MPRFGYSDNVSTRDHCEALASYIAELPVTQNNDWPVVAAVLLPSARNMIVKALREHAKTLDN